MGKVIRFPGPSSLPPEMKKVLRDQEISEDGPGTILRDLQMLLDFIGQKGTKVSAKNGFLPMKALNELNTRMTRPIEIGLKRPMQKSFPHINGLYLLLRASGLARLKGSGTKRFLMPDDALCRSWAELNPTEQYFSLLEAWLIRGKSEIIGEHMGILDVPILGWINFFKRLAVQGFDSGKDKNAMDLIRYSPGIHTIGILDLFGFISVRSGKAEPGKGWNIRKIRQTDLGVALLALLYSIAEETDQEISPDYFYTFTFGSGETLAALQSAIQGFFSRVAAQAGDTGT